MNLQNTVNTKEIYDFIPKYVQKNQTEQPTSFSEIERDFVFRDEIYKVRLRPAPLYTVDGVESQHLFAGIREEIVEQGLRKLIAGGRGKFLDDGESFAFTIYELKRELESAGRYYAIKDIKEAIQVLFRMGMTLIDSSGSKTYFHPISSFGIREARGNTTFVVLAREILHSVNSGVFTDRDYEMLLAYSSNIARQLHRRLRYHAAVRSAGALTVYLSEIAGESGEPVATRPAQLRLVVKALDEMKTRGAIEAFECERVTDAERRNKLVDARFTLKLRTVS